MRGKELKDVSGQLKNGITPAYAGKSFEFVARILMNRDHPRLCGEKAIKNVFNGIGEGSPPPMRGKGAAGTYFDGNHGITPAYAGKRLPLFKQISL